MLANGLKNIEVSDIELNKKEKLYAKDAFKLIEESYKNAEIFFIMGADNFINITNWKEVEVLKKYKYIILDRDNIKINKGKWNVQIITNDNYANCNSTKFRNEVREKNEYSQEMVPDAVIDYIIEKGLYREKIK